MKRSATSVPQSYRITRQRTSVSPSNLSAFHMPTMRRTTSRRYSKRRYPTRRKSAAPRRSFNRRVKAAVLKASETKMLETSWAKKTCGPGEPICFLLPSIKQGDGKSNRNGDRVSPVYIDIKGHLVVEKTMAASLLEAAQTATGVTIEDKVEQFMFRTTLLQVKDPWGSSFSGTPLMGTYSELGDGSNSKDQDTESMIYELDLSSQSISNFYRRNGQSFSTSQGLLETLYVDVNTDQYQVLYDRVTTMNTNNEKSHFIKINVPLFKKAKMKYLKWGDNSETNTGQRWPSNYYILLVQPVAADGDNTQAGLLEFNGSLKFAFKDV